MTRIGLWSIAVVAVIVSGCSKPQEPAPQSAEQSSKTPATVGTGGAGANLSDDEFVHDVALKNMAEIEFSRIALGKTANPTIKSFAQKTIDDQNAAGRDLKNVLSGQTMEWPAQLDGKYRKALDELAAAHGADFDAEYVKAMVESQQDLAAKLESRLDVQSLADWKTAAAGRTDSKALPEPGTSLHDVRVRPNNSGNAVTLKINQWAADTYPVVQKQLDTARTLKTAMK